MPAEDALYRAMRPIAESLVKKHQHNGATLDAERIVEETLDQFRPVVELDEHVAALRVRLREHVERQLTRVDS